MLNIAVFVSGKGSNLRAIHDAIVLGTLDARICLVLGSRPDAPALDWAASEGIPTGVISHRSDDTDSAILGLLEEHGADSIALAGYLKLVPPAVVRAFQHRMLNIHPALLPAFGGAGMYGRHVHEAVLAAGVKVSGATVHVVDEEYDRGPIVMQECVPVLEDDTASTLASRVLEVEHRLFPRALQLFAENRVNIENGKAIIQ